MPTARKNVHQLRRVPRRTFDHVVGILLYGKYQLERALQVGEGGMMITSSRPIGIGESVVISFVINQETIVMVRGRVRNEIPANPKIKAPVRYNVEFQNLEFQYKRAIRNYVASATEAESFASVSTVY